MTKRVTWDETKELKDHIRTLRAQISVWQGIELIWTKQKAELQEELATTAARIEELESEAAAIRGSIGAVVLAGSIIQEARASVRLDKNKDGSSVTQSAWDLPEKEDEWGQSYGRCDICGTPINIVRPGKGQLACDCQQEGAICPDY